MEEELRRAWKELPEPYDRERLRNLLEETFLSLYHHSEEQYHALENRVMEELGGEAFRYDIYTGLASRQQYDASDSFLFPMEEKDAGEGEDWNLADIKETLQREERYFVKKVFFQCGHRTLTRMLERQKLWRGTVRTELGDCEACFELERERGYGEKLKELYEVFLDNGVPWKPVNAPYLDKMVNIYLVGCRHDLKKDREIRDILPDLGEYRGMVREGRMPLWNIKRVRAKTMGFAWPIDGRKRYEHKISLAEEGPGHGYLIGKEENGEREVRRSERYLHAVSDSDESRIWPLLKIVSPRERKNEYEGVFGNAPAPSFLEAYSRRPAFPIRTRAEIERVFYSCPHMTNLELLGYYFTGEEGEWDSYDIQEFKRDAVRPGGNRERMVFTLHEKEPSYLSGDLMSYFVALMQDYFPEYRCGGVLL